MVSEADPFVAEVRESFGRVAYSHKTHEKEAERKAAHAFHLRGWNVAAFGIAAIAAVAAPLLESVAASWTAAGAVILGFVFTALQLSFNPAAEGASHRLAAKEYLARRNDYMRFIADLRSVATVTAPMRTRRDGLAQQVRQLDALAPQTSAKAYAQARKALRTDEELTFDSAELDQLLPAGAPLDRPKAPRD